MAADGEDETHRFWLRSPMVDAWARIAEAAERIAAALELQAQIALGDRGITEAEVREKSEAVRAAAAETPAAEKQALPKDFKAPLSERGLPLPMSLTEQSPLDILVADLAYAHAEKSFGRGKVPPDLDLASYAEEHGIEVDPGPEIIEPEGGVPADIEERIAELRSKMREGS